MRYRSYEYYEIRTNLGKDDEKTISWHSDLSTARIRFNALTDTHHNIYLVRVNLIEARKVDKTD